MWEAMSLTTAPALMSLPIPRPGHAVSLAMTVRSLAPRLNERIDEAMRRTDAHEAADHERGAVGDQRGGRISSYRDFHLNPPSFRVRILVSIDARIVPLLCAIGGRAGGYWCPECRHLGAGAPADRIGRSLRRLGRRALVAEKVEGLPEVFAWRHGVSAGGASAIGRGRRGRAPGGRVGGDLFFERLEIGGSRGRRGRRLGRGRGGLPAVGQRLTPAIARRPVAASLARPRCAAACG